MGKLFKKGLIRWTSTRDQMRHDICFIQLTGLITDINLSSDFIWNLFPLLPSTSVQKLFCRKLFRSKKKSKSAYFRSQIQNIFHLSRPDRIRCFFNFNSKLLFKKYRYTSENEIFDFILSFRSRYSFIVMLFFLILSIWNGKPSWNSLDLDARFA